MLKKILAVILSTAALLCMAGCAKEYVMTEADLAQQRAAEGFWMADDSTGYNQYDEYGNFLSLTVVEFTSDFNYLLHTCMPGDEYADGYVQSGSPIHYGIERGDFMVEFDGVKSYAKVSFSDDGQTMYWDSGEETDIFHRMSDEDVAKYCIPVYDPARWAETESVGEETEDGGADTVSE